jgi:tripartite-type tricarboxylate transporter receptor subunit TctC
MKAILGLLWSIGLVVGLAAAPGQAQTIESFYSGKQIEFIVGADAGTSHDTWVRLIAKYFPKYIPGRPTFVVRNMPGAGHIIATNYLYQRAPRDGLTIGLVSDAMPLTSVLKTKAALQADFGKFYFLGSPDRAYPICVTRPDSKIQKAEDLANTEMLVGGAGVGSAISFIPTFVKSLLGWKLNIIEGYKSSQEVMLAVERGELDGMCQAYQGLQRARPDALQKGTLKLLFTLEPESLPGTSAPSISKFVTTQDQRDILAYQQAGNMGRSILAPPETPIDRVEAFRRAFGLIIKDREFLDEAEKQGLDPAPSTSEEQDRKYKILASIPSERLKRLAELLGE